MSRRYNTAESKNRRELLIKRFKKEYTVVENYKVLFKSVCFDLCVEFIEREVQN